MSRFGFVGPSYTSQSVSADCQLTQNWYPELIESGAGKSLYAMYPTPGLQILWALDRTPVRGVFTVNGQTFAVAGDSLYELLQNPDKTYRFNNRGVVGNDGLPVTWGANSANQLIVCSNGNLFVYPLSPSATQTGSLTLTVNEYAIANPQGNFISNINIVPNSPSMGQTTVTITCTAALNFVSGAAINVKGTTLNGNLATINGYQPPSVTVVASNQFSYVILATLSSYSGAETGGCCVVDSPCTVRLGTVQPCTFVVGSSYTLTGAVNSLFISNPGPPNNPIIAVDNTSFSFQLAGFVPVQPTTTSGTATATGTSALTSLIQVNRGAGPFSFVDFFDGFFVALVANSAKFQISALEDGTSWDAANVSQVSEFPDNVVSMLVNEELCWFFGNTKTVPYYDSGAPFTPIIPVETTLIEQGTAAANSRVKLDNSIFWLGKDERGQGIAWRAQGYTPTRVSTSAVEYTWSQYPTISDAVGYSYQDQGHSFWVLYFPSAAMNKPDGTLIKGATWVYDVKENMWHQRDDWRNGVSSAHPSWCHTFNFNQHIVGDPHSGNIYSMSIVNLTNAGNNIRRVRRAPHVSVEQEWIRHNQLQIYLESGLATFPGGAPTGQINFVLQDVNGQNWSFRINNDGTLTSVKTTEPVTVSMWQDVTNANVFWALTVDSSGRIVGSQQVQAPAQFFTILPMVSTGVYSPGNTGPLGAEQAFIWVNNGIIQDNLTPVYRGGIVELRYSNDGGHTWSNPRQLDCGKLGQYKTRVIARRLGRGRDRVYEISTTDPFPVRIIDAYLKATPGFQPQERLSDQLRKVG